jgi:hypothetical protein
VTQRDQRGKETHRRAAVGTKQVRFKRRHPPAGADYLENLGVRFPLVTWLDFESQRQERVHHHARILTLKNAMQHRSAI